MTSPQTIRELPLINKKEMTLLHEHIGLSLGIKKASIFYVPSENLEQYRKHFERQGYHVESSSFSYSYDAGNAHLQQGEPHSASRISLYVSREAHIANRLKYLDYLQQTKAYIKEGISGNDVFFELAEILGYPRCCSSFLQEIGRDGRFLKQRQGLGTLFSNETLYPMLALKESSYVSPLLNNFSEGIPSLITFHVCRYDCPNALSIAEKILAGAVQGGYSTPQKLCMLRSPLLFFSPRDTIFLPNAIREGGSIIYSPEHITLRQNAELVKEEDDSVRQLYNFLLQGDLLKITENDLQVYSDNSFVGVKMKKHLYDGVFVSFDA